MNLGMNLGMNTVVVSSYEISCYCIPTIMWLSGHIPLLCQLEECYSTYCQIWATLYLCLLSQTLPGATVVA